MTKSNLDYPKSVLPYAIFIIPALFYFYEFFVQISPSVMTHQLMQHWHIDAATLGFISAIFYYGYTPMQIVGGVLYDHFDARYIISAAILLCALGTLGFSMSDTILQAYISRFAIGAGSAFAFTGTLVLASRWFPVNRFALLVGLTQLLGSFGAIIGESPLAASVKVIGWRPTLMFVAFAGFALAAVALLVIRNQPAQKVIKVAKDPKKRAIAFKKFYRNSQTWLIALYSFTSWAPILVLAALWGVPYLMVLYHIGAVAASSVVAFIWLGTALGSPFSGWWSHHIQRRCLPLASFSAIGLIAIMIMLYGSNIPFPLMYVLFFAIGFAASGQSLAFAVVKDNNSPETIGAAIGLNNMAIVAGGALYQPLAGLLLRWHWGGLIQNGIPIYTVANFKDAFEFVIPCYIVGIIIATLLIKETHCKTVFSYD
jgi:MFS family permease